MFSENRKQLVGMFKKYFKDEAKKEFPDMELDKALAKYFIKHDYHGNLDTICNEIAEDEYRVE